MSEFSIRDINMYLKKDVKLPLSLDKKNIKERLLNNYKNKFWNKGGCKTHYNFYVINKLLGFNIKYL